MVDCPSCPGTVETKQGTRPCPEPPLPLAISYLPASEWYFRECHRSLPMETETALMYLQAERAARASRDRA